MPFLINSTPRVEQLQHPGAINWNSPLARGLVFCAIPVGTSFFDCVTRQLTNSGAGLSVGKANRGLGVTTRYGDGGNCVFPFRTLADNISGPHSIFVDGSPFVNGQTNYVIESYEGTNGDGFGVRWDDAAVFTNSFQYRGNNGGISGNSTPDVLGSNSEQFYHRIMVAKDSANTYIYANGVLDATDASAGFPTANVNRRTRINSRLGSVQNGAAGLVLIWNRTLLLQEYKSLYDNPWQLFILPRRLYTLQSGGAATHTTTGALSADVATIAGTATHLTLHATSGALASQVATIAGVAAHEHATTGALSTQSATIAGTAAHLTLHQTSGALDSQAATVAGTAAHEHATTGALASDAATIAGDAAHTVDGAHATSGSLAADAATIAGVATHLTLHATSGALSSDAATIDGTAAHAVIHDTTGGLAAQAATIEGTATNGTQPVARVEIGGGVRKHKSAKEEREEFLDEIVREALTPAKPTPQLPEPLKPVLEARPVVAKPAKPVPLSIPPSLEVEDDDDKVIAALINLGIF